MVTRRLYRDLYITGGKQYALFRRVSRQVPYIGEEDTLSRKGIWATISELPLNAVKFAKLYDNTKKYIVVARVKILVYIIDVLSDVYGCHRRQLASPQVDDEAIIRHTVLCLHITSQVKLILCNKFYIAREHRCHR